MLVSVYPGQSKDEAMEEYFTEHPDMFTTSTAVSLLALCLAILPARLLRLAAVFSRNGDLSTHSIKIVN